LSYKSACAIKNVQRDIRRRLKHWEEVKSDEDESGGADDCTTNI
jgi:hypothetical protein